MKYLSLILLLITINTVNASEIDQAYEAINKRDFKKAIEFSDIAILKENTADRIGEAYFTKAYSLSKIGRQEEAINTYWKCISVFETEVCKARAYSNMAIIYRKIGLYSQSYDLYTKALSLNIDAKRQVSYIINRAVALKHMGEYGQAQEEVISALELATDISSVKHQYNALNQIGLILKDSEEYENAISYFESANRLEYKKKTFHNIGRCYEASGNFLAAIENYQIALKNTTDITWQYRGLQSIGENYYLSGNEEEAKRYLLIAVDVLNGIKDVESEDVEIYKLLAELSPFDEKIMYKDKYIAYIERENSKQKVLMSDYEKRIIIANEVKNKNEKQKEKLTYSILQIAGVCIVLIVLLIVAYQKIRNYRNKRTKDLTDIKDFLSKPVN